MSPRPVKWVHQIEVTSRCNLRCRYCTHPKMKRAKIDMTEEMFRRTLDVCHELQMRNGKQRELNLAGIGESTMHPQLADFMRMSKERMPWVTIILATNGVTLTKELSAAIKPYAPMVWVSLHRPEVAAKAVNILRDDALYAGASTDPSLSSVNWAGQVDWPVTAKRQPCDWLHFSKVMVMSDGRATTCCFDAEGAGIVAQTPEELLSASHGPYSLCETCHLSSDFPL